MNHKFKKINHHDSVYGVPLVKYCCNIFKLKLELYIVILCVMLLANSFRTVGLCCCELLHGIGW
jgi:hypothetical protein